MCSAWLRQRITCSDGSRVHLDKTSASSYVSEGPLSKVGFAYYIVTNWSPTACFIKGNYAYQDKDSQMYKGAFWEYYTRNGKASSGRMSIRILTFIHVSIQALSTRRWAWSISNTTEYVFAYTVYMYVWATQILLHFTDFMVIFLVIVVRSVWLHKICYDIINERDHNNKWWSLK